MPEHLQNGPEKHQKTDTGDDTALGLFQQGARKSYDLIYDFFLAGKFFDKLLCKSILKAKTLGNAEKHGRNRNDGKQGVKSQRGCPQYTAVLIIAAQGQNDDPQLLNEEGSAERKIGQSHPPYTNTDKRKKIGNKISPILF